MKKCYLLLSCALILGISLTAQSTFSDNIDHGIVLSSRIDSDDNLRFQIKGYGVEVGYYGLKKIGRKSSIGLDLRLVYSQSERSYENVGKIVDPILISTNPIMNLRSGIVKYSDLSIAIPIKYRYQFFEDIPLYGLLGINPYFSISNNSKWNFTDKLYDRVNDVVLSESEGEEQFEQRLLSNDILLAGLGYRNGNIMLEVYFSRGNIRINNDFIMGMDKTSFVINMYYRLGKG